MFLPFITSFCTPSARCRSAADLPSVPFVWSTPPQPAGSTGDLGQSFGGEAEEGAGGVDEAEHGLSDLLAVGLVLAGLADDTTHFT